MSLRNYMKMSFSFHDGWDTLYAVHPSMLKTCLLLVLPFSMIAPAMLLYAGSHHASAYLMDATHVRWQAVALTFFVAEFLTVPLMGWMIRQIAAVHKIATDAKDTFLLAAITSIPMCLSSLGLAIPNMWMVIGLVVLGLLLAASVLYHGSYYILSVWQEM